MRIGIYTHYAQCDQAYFAVRLADFLRTQDVTLSIYADNKPAKLKTIYDNAVAHRAKVKFTTWARHQDIIIWTHVPKIEQITYAKRYGVLTVLAPMWQELKSPFRKAIKHADHVIAMSVECRELYQAVYKFKHTTLIPFDAGLPAIRKDAPVDPRNVRLFLPWFDQNARCAQQVFLTHLREILTRMPEARLTVGVTSSRFSPSIAQFFNRLSERTEGRVNLLRRVAFRDRPQLFMNHDLTLVPAECDNYGLCGLMSINCGTPILTFAVSPQIDFAYPDTNAVVVKTKVNYDEYGVAHADPDYYRYFTLLQTIIAEPQHIDSMNKRINYNLNSRRKSFETGWQSILRLV